MHASKNSHFFMLRSVYPAVFLMMAAVLTVLRRPDAFFRPQFFAEDGHYWYAQAYQLGAAGPLLLPSAGYLQTFSRLMAGFSLLFPIEAAPLVFNLAALAVQLLPVAYLLSHRYRNISFSTRLALCITFLLFTNTAEAFLNLTNAQWYLGLAAFLIIAGQPAQTVLKKTVDAAVLVVAGLSGPFSIFLIPVVFWLLAKRHLHWQSIRARLAFLTASIQMFTLLRFAAVDGGRFSRQIELSLEWAYKIFARQVVWGGLAGPASYDWFQRLGTTGEWLMFLTAGLALALAGYTLWRSRPPLQALILFAATVFTASFLSPTIYGDGQRTIHQVMFAANGIRYWLLPMSALLAVFFWSARKENPLAVKAGGWFFLSCLLALNLRFLLRPTQLRYPAYVNYRWREEVHLFQSVPSGSGHMFRLNPPGWQMTLIKK